MSNQALIDKLSDAAQVSLELHREKFVKDIPVLIHREKVGGSYVITLTQGGAFKFSEPIEDNEEVMSIFENALFEKFKAAGFNINFNILRQNVIN